MEAEREFVCEKIAYKFFLCEKLIGSAEKVSSVRLDRSILSPLQGF